MKGIFIVLEGADLGGKSTQAALLAGYLHQKYRRAVIRMREPGGTEIGDKIRRLLLDYRNKAMTVETELFLYMASRAQLVHERLAPALKKGNIVVCDRYLYSSAAYQGAAGRLGIDRVLEIGRLAVREVMPDLTLILDVDPRIAYTRSRRRRDRVERKGVEYQRCVRQGFLALARQFRRTVRVIDANRPIPIVQDEIRSTVEHELF